MTGGGIDAARQDDAYREGYEQAEAQTVAAIMAELKWIVEQGGDTHTLLMKFINLFERGDWKTP